MASGASIRPRGSVLHAPLSYGQEQIWLHSQLVPEIALYNEPVTLKKSGPLDVPVLQRALNEIVRRHESWRTTFGFEGEQLIQTVRPAVDVQLQVADLRHISVDRREEESLHLAAQDSLLPLDLANGPLVRALLVHVADEDHRLHLTLHHIIFDGTSIYRVLMPELAAIYEAFLRDEPSPLPELPVQFADFATWQREWLAQSGALDSQLSYWRKQLQAVSMPQLPLDRQRPPVQSFRGAIQPLALKPELSQKLKLLARQNGCTLFMALLAGFAGLLYRYSESEDIAIGTVSSSRKRSELEGLLGYFLNPLVMRNDFSGDPSFRQALKRAREVTLDALSNDDAPFTQIVNELHPARTLSCNPLIQALFTLEPPMPAELNGWSVALSHSRVDTHLVKFDLCLELDDAPEGISGRLKFNTDLFDPATAASMASHFETLLESAAADPDIPLSRLPMLSASERERILVKWNQTSVHLPAAPSIHSLFEAQAKKRPDAVALVHQDTSLSYGELDRRAAAVARHLVEHRLGPDKTAGIFMDPCPDMLIAILGVLKAGGAYIPLDPSYPRQRLQTIVRDAQPTVLLTTAAEREKLGKIADVEIVCVDHLDTSRQIAPALPTVSADNLAYILYTSGTTGTPRGVEITHGNLVHSTTARLDYYKTSQSSRFLLLSSFAFDSSLAGIFGTLCGGGTLVLCPGPVQNNLPDLAKLVAENQITELLCVPSVYALLLEQARHGQLSTLDHVILAGEACHPDLVQRHYRQLPKTKLYNEYGPTEATVWCSVEQCSPEQHRPLVPIGRPIADTQIYLLDRHLNPVPAGVPGELCIAGPGVARGYRNRPELTAEKFVVNPFAVSAPNRLYRSGDLARHLSDGSLELLGRLDEQVKIRGFRVELDEISSVICTYPGIREAVAVLRDQDRLVAYYVASSPGVSESSLRSFLKDHLPEYMVPSAIASIDRLPQLPNGKLDRSALPTISAVSATAVVPAAGEVETQLAEIFEEILGKHGIGRGQSFFDLGGHSLLLARLILHIEEAFGRRLSWSEVFRAPTIGDLAAFLEAADSVAPSSAIIPIQPSGSMSPLFWVRGGPLYLGLARRLGNDQPLLGLDLPPADAAQLPAPCRIEDIASALIKNMRSVQPHGPYHLAGLCVNGVIAYEMAAQLRDAGDHVGLLALFDAQNPAFYHDFSQEGRGRATWNKIDFHVGKLLNASPAALPGMMRERITRTGQRLNVLRWRLQRRFAVAPNERDLQDLDTIIHPASYDYRPKPYTGKVLFFQSSDWPKGSHWDFFAGWRELVPSMEIYRVQGGHESMFADSHVRPIFEGLQEALKSSSQESNFPNSATA